MTYSAVPSIGFRCFLMGLLLGLCTVPAKAQELESAEFQDPYEVRDEIEEILSAPEFRGLKFERSEAEITESDFELGDMPEWIRPIAEAISYVLGPALSYLFWTVLVIICCLIAYVAYRGIMESSLSSSTAGRMMIDFEAGEADRSPADLTADEYLKRAIDLAARGETREAISQLLLGAMSFIEREGLIRFRRGLTSRDYLRAARSQQDQFAALKQIVRVYEPICFGRRAALPEHYETSLENYLGAFHAT